MKVLRIFLNKFCEFRSSLIDPIYYFCYKIVPKIEFLFGQFFPFFKLLLNWKKSLRAAKDKKWDHKFNMRTFDLTSFCKMTCHGWSSIEFIICNYLYQSGYNSC